MASFDQPSDEQTQKILEEFTMCVTISTRRRIPFPAHSQHLRVKEVLPSPCELFFPFWPPLPLLFLHTNFLPHPL